MGSGATHCSSSFTISSSPSSAKDRAFRRTDGRGCGGGVGPGDAVTTPGDAPRGGGGGGIGLEPNAATIAGGVAPAVVSARCSVSPSSTSSTSMPNDGARAGRRFECSSSDADPPSPKAGSAIVPSESTRTIDEKLSSL